MEGELGQVIPILDADCSELSDIALFSGVIRSCYFSYCFECFYSNFRDLSLRATSL